MKLIKLNASMKTLIPFSQLFYLLLPMRILVLMDANRCCTYCTNVCVASAGLMELIMN